MPIFGFHAQNLISSLHTQRQAGEKQKDHPRNGLQQPPLSSLWLQTLSPHPRASVTSRKVSTARAARLPPPHSISSKVTAGAGPSPSSIHLNTLKKGTRTYLLRRSTQNSWPSFEMKSPSDLHPENLASAPDRSRTSSPSSNPPDKIESPRNRRSR